MPDQDNQQQGGPGNKVESNSGDRKENTSQTGGSQQAGQAAAPATEKEKSESPSNAGDAGFGSSSNDAQGASADRLEQMSHADGSDDEPNPDV